MKISPSILSADFCNLESDVQLIEDTADYLHVDVMDGHFVPNLTIGPPHVKALKKVTKLPLDVHLMIDNPRQQLKWYVDAGADIITIHFEANKYFDEDFEFYVKHGKSQEYPYKSFKDIADYLHENNVLAGISINPDTAIESVQSYVRYFDLVLVMSVYPGFGGQSFIEESLEKIQKLDFLRDANQWGYLIEVDGGINVQTAPLCAQVGADIVVAGNAVFGADDPVLAIQNILDSCK
ncbi:MAG: ribulose-phosphate 3-epimerase [Coriobacteriales bacterium]|nr:ribulose-phosphate 3-epimerase [Coriobacteriales bacterium]